MREEKDREGGSKNKKGKEKEGGTKRVLYEEATYRQKLFRCSLEGRSLPPF
jgi:hypothetical protein